MGSRSSRLVAAVLVGGGLLAACGNAKVTTSTFDNASGVSAHKIVVGGLASLTGPLPADFAPAMAGAAAYFDAVNARGGVNGRHIDLAYRLDDQSDPSSDTAAARTLVDQDHVFAVVPVASPSFAGGTFLSSHDVPTFGLDVNPNSDWAGESMYGTTGSYTNYKGAQLQAGYLAEQHHITSAAVIAYNIAQSVEGCDSVLYAFRKYGIHVAYKDLSVPVPAFSLSADVTRMKAAHVDMVVSCLDLTGNVLLAHTMEQQGITGVTQFWYDGYDESALRQFHSAMQGVYFFLANVPFEVTTLDPGKYPGMDNFVAAMRRYEPHTEPGQAALSGWQSADLFVTGLRKIGRDVTRTRLVAALNSISIYTANGIDAPIDWRDGHSTNPGPWNCGAFVQVQGSRFVPVYGTPPSVFNCLPVPDPAHAPLVPITPLPKGVPPLPGSSSGG